MKFPSASAISIFVLAAASSNLCVDGSIYAKRRNQEAGKNESESPRSESNDGGGNNAEAMTGVDIDVDNKKKSEKSKEHGKSKRSECKHELLDFCSNKRTPSSKELQERINKLTSAAEQEDGGMDSPSILSGQWHILCSSADAALVNPIFSAMPKVLLKFIAELGFVANTNVQTIDVGAGTFSSVTELETPMGLTSLITEAQIQIDDNQKIHLMLTSAKAEKVHNVGRRTNTKGSELDKDWTILDLGSILELMNLGDGVFEEVDKRAQASLMQAAAVADAITGPLLTILPLPDLPSARDTAKSIIQQADYVKGLNEDLLRELAENSASLPVMELLNSILAGVLDSSALLPMVDLVESILDQLMSLFPVGDALEKKPLALDMELLYSDGSVLITKTDEGVHVWTLN